MSVRISRTIFVYYNKKATNVKHPEPKNQIKCSLPGRGVDGFKGPLLSASVISPSTSM